jgi:general secretion pathway protein A
MYHLQPLSLEETGEYIRHRLTVAGGTREDLFTPEAVQGIYYYARGFPRLVNILCDRALLAAYADDKTQVDRPLVDEVQRELDFPSVTTDGRPGGWIGAPAAEGSTGVVEGTGDLAERLRKLDEIDANVREIRASLKNLENLLNFSLWVDRNV